LCPWSCKIFYITNPWRIYLFFCIDGKKFKKPRRPYEKKRLDAEMKLVGEYGLRAKRELWRVQYALSRIRNAARMLLALDEKNQRCIFEGDAFLRRMNRYGFLEESQNKLDYVLALTVENCWWKWSERTRRLLVEVETKKMRNELVMFSACDFWLML